MLLFCLIMGLLISLGAIARFARGRGVSPSLAVGVALFGFLFFWFAGGLLLALAESLLMSSTRGPLFAFTSDGQLIMMLSAWGWIAAVALFVRFRAGVSRPSPTGSWTCPNCRYTNAQYANICEACEQPWGQEGLGST